MVTEHNCDRDYVIMFSLIRAVGGCAYLVFHVIHHHQHLLHEVGEILAVQKQSTQFILSQIYNIIIN